MRLAILADIHANLEALDAVLDDAARWGEHQLIVAGDIVGYGADPEACIARLQERGAQCVAGNHEGMVLGRLGFSHCVHAGIRAARWTNVALAPWAKKYLAELPAHRMIGDDVVVCHGDLDNPEQYVKSEGRCLRTLGRMNELYPEGRVLICGHTHARLCFVEGDGLLSTSPRLALSLPLERRALINPGAVGQARDHRPLASYARFDTETGKLVFVELAYDHVRTVRKLKDAGLVARVLQPQQENAWERLLTRWARFASKPITESDEGGTRSA